MTKSRLEWYYEMEEIMNYRKTILTINRNKEGDRKVTVKVYNDGYIQYFYSSSRMATEKNLNYYLKVILKKFL